MTRDDIIRMAREAGVKTSLFVLDGKDSGYFCLFERFAYIVAATEREACAKRLDAVGCDHCAENIRLRGRENEIRTLNHHIQSLIDTMKVMSMNKQDMSNEIERLKSEVETAVKAEREACASIEVHLTTPDRDYTTMSPLDAYEAALMDAAVAFREAIRARGQGWVKTYSGGKPNYTQPIEQEPFEYWNAVEGWVKIDEVRQHFDTAGCGTIYKTAGEDRVPLYAAPPKKEWVGFSDEEPVAWGVDEGEGRCISLHDLYFVKGDADHMAELKGTHAKVVALYTAPPKKEWVGLTKEELAEIAEFHFHGAFSGRDFYDDVEAKLKEKNT